MTARRGRSGGEQQLWLYGIHAVAAVLEHRPGDVAAVYLFADARGSRLEQLAGRCRDLGVTVHSVDRRRLDRLVGGAVHQGVVAQVRAPGMLGERDLEQLVVEVDRPLFLVLDEIQDPQNLGACLRSADGAAVTGVIIAARGGAGLTPAVWKASSGAVERTRLIRVAGLGKALTVLASAGVRLIGLSDAVQTPYYDIDLCAATALVLGSEGRGLRHRIAQQCHQLVSIPMRGYCTSLNLSVAAGVCAYEALRQRSGTGRG